jgi:hypothetical protein
MKKFFPVLIVLVVVVGIQLSKKSPKETSIRSNEKTFFSQPTENKNICSDLKESTLYVNIKGKFGKEKINLTCTGKDLKLTFFSDYVAQRGTYEIRCKKSHYYFSMGIRNPVVKRLIRPHIPYREVPSNFNFTLEKSGKKVSQKDTKASSTHNIESLLYLEKVNRQEKSTSMRGCMEFKFARESKSITSGDLKISFNLNIKG